MSDPDRCEWCEMDYCLPPKIYTDAGFHCSHALPIQPGDITNKCGATDKDLMRVEEFEHAERCTNPDCHDDKGKFFLHPIINWSNSDVWDHIRTNKMPYCSLYDEGKMRIGCIMCPMQNTKGRLQDAKRFPKYYNAYLRAFGRMLKSLKAKGKVWRHGNTPEQVMYWWIHNADMDLDTIQDTL